MPWSTIENMPEYTKKYSKVVRRQMLHVFNSVYASTGDEKRAMMAMNSVLKKRFSKKEQTWNKNENDYVLHLLDKWLGNLPG